MTNWTTWIRMPNGGIVQVFIQAETAYFAQQLFESQYGKANVVHLATPVN
jgi:hypothetical protein